MEWKKYRLGCLSHSIQTGPFGSQLHQSDYSEEGTPVIMPKDIVEGRVVEDNIARVSDIHIQRLKRHKVKCGDVVYSRRGDVGRCALVGEKEDGWLCGTGCLKVELNKEKVLPPFLFYILQRQDSVGWVESHAVGSTMPNLNTGILAKLPVFLPTLNLQHRIASILSTYDTLIENNTKRIHLLEKMAENLYKEWFVRFRFPGYEKVEMENGLPKGWKIARIKDYGRIETGKTPSTKVSANYVGKYMFIKTPDMHDGIFVNHTEETLSDIGNNSQPKKLLPPNSIMVSCIGTGGVVAINTLPAHTNQQINSIVLSDNSNLEWLYYVCKGLKPTIELFGATGATMTNLSKGKFEKMKLIEPPKDIRVEFHNKIMGVFELINKLTNQNTLLVRQRDLLLPRLMSGKLEVKP